MGRSRSRTTALSSGLIGSLLCYFGHVAFVATRGWTSRPIARLSPARPLVVSQASADNLVWPSPEAWAQVRKENNIDMYPTHSWDENMKPIVPASVGLDSPPVIIGVAADSGCGKTTFLQRIFGVLGTDVSQGHTAVGDVMTVVCLDDYHLNDREGRKVTGKTALDVRENDFGLMGSQIEALKQGMAVYKPIYNHDTGEKDAPELVEPNKLMVFEGLHPIYDKKAREQLDLGIYIDIVDDVKFAWKVQRDVAERGWTEEQVRQDIAKRITDFEKYVDPQKANADVILRYEASDHGLPYLKVKLIQKKNSAFLPVRLKADLNFAGSKTGAILSTYDDEWFGSPVSVIEMDGEIDVDNFSQQLRQICDNMEGIGSHDPYELVDVMNELRETPGTQNGTGLFQSVIAIKIRDIYERITGQPM